MNLPARGRPPFLSIVVIVYNMRREAARTLRSLAVPYQRDVSADDYEVIVIENGSPEPLSESEVGALGENFHYFFVENAHPSPAQAMNLGVEKSRGELVALMIDGARMLSPGVIRYVRQAALLAQNPVILVPSWHLGSKQQNHSVLEGYDRVAEDALLDRIGWPADGYRLFEIAALAGSYRGGLLITPPESNFVVLPRGLFDGIGGFDERFQLPGGGLVNLDFFSRVAGVPDSELIQILGEGSFHQIHGGAATNSAASQWKIYAAEYEKIRGVPYAKPTRPLKFFGHAPAVMQRFLSIPPAA